MKKIGILYICTGRYVIFWNTFFTSSEQYLLKNKNYEIHYFVFTDAKEIDFENNERVHKFYQKHMKWPYPTLYRFKFFNRKKKEYEDMDYLYFCNANTLFVDHVGEEILPDNDRGFAFLQHPCFYDKEINSFTYESNEKSLSFIPKNKGKYYFMGSLNGGAKKDYLKMCQALEKNIDIDHDNNIIATWYDESHLNKFAITNEEKIKILDPSFGFPEELNLPLKPKIILRQKKQFEELRVFLKNKHNKYLIQDYINRMLIFLKKHLFQ